MITKMKLLCLVALLALTTSVGATTNVLLNPGFEAGPAWGTPDYWVLGQAEAKRNTNLSHTGDACTHYIHTGGQAAFYQDVAVRPNGTYDLSFWKLHYVGDQWARVYMNVTAVDGTSISSLASNATQGALGQWYQAAASGVNVGNRETVRVWIKGSPNSWEPAVYVDDTAMSCDDSYLSAGVLNGDFAAGGFRTTLGWLNEGGTHYYGGGTMSLISDDPAIEGNQTQQAKASTILYNVPKNTECTITWDSLQSYVDSYSRHFIEVLDMSDTVLASATKVSPGNNWVSNTLTFDSGNNSELRLRFKGTTGWWLPQVSIDNVVFVPEPATMAMLALGSLILSKRRRV